MSATSKWFAPADEYLAATEDYAVVGESALYVKNHLIDDPSYHNLDGFLRGGPEPRLEDMLEHPLLYGDIFRDEDDARLVYADVDRDNEEHVQKWKDAAKAGVLEEESDRIKGAKKKLFDYLSTHYHYCAGTHYHSCVSEETDEDELPESESEQLRASIEKSHERTGHVSKRMIDYVLKLKEEGDRRDILTILSRQHRRKSQRPVLLLISMVEKFSKGVKEGWLIGYDFYNNNIIIKPYHAVDRTQHPLAEKWDVSLPEDGVSWKGRPAEFVTEKIHSRLNPDKDLDSAGAIDSYGYQLLVYYSVARWIFTHWDAVASIEPSHGGQPMGVDERKRLQKACETMVEQSENILFPYKRPEEEEKASASPMPTFQYMQTLLEDYEMNVRFDALKAKEAGKEDVARNVAKLYEQLLLQLQSFNANPEKPS
ncbi:MAG: hypothetical protein Q9213_005146 [Squamulea squamosa]